MDLINLLKLAGITVQAQPVSSEPSCGCGMGESEGAGFDQATTEPNPEEFPDGISTLGSVSDTSLRRYLKAKGDHVTVDENIYPDYAVEDVAESYKAFAEKAKNPYAVGMAQAMKSTGDEPPLKKSTIKKAHDIAKAVNEEGKMSDQIYFKSVANEGRFKDMYTELEELEPAIMRLKTKYMDQGMEPEEAQDEACEMLGCDPEMFDEYLTMKFDESTLDEADIDENAFNQAAAAAARANKGSFEFNGKTYKTKMDKSTAHKLDDDIDMLRKLAGISEQPLTPAQDKEARLMTLMPPEPVRDRSGNKRPTVPGQQSMNQIMKQQSKFSQSPVLRRQAAQAYVQNKSNPNWN